MLSTASFANMKERAPCMFLSRVVASTDFRIGSCPSPRATESIRWRVRRLSEHSEEECVARINIIEGESDVIGEGGTEGLVELDDQLLFPKPNGVEESEQVFAIAGKFFDSMWVSELDCIGITFVG